MKTLLIFTLFLSASVFGQVSQMDAFSEKLIKAYFSKDIKTIQSLMATKADIKKLRNDLYLKDEEYKNFDKILKEEDVFADPKTFWKDLDDIIFYKELETLKGLDLKNYEIMTSIMVEAETVKNGIVEIYYDIMLKSNDQYFFFEFSELIYTKENGFQFFEFPDVELLSENIWNKSTGFNVTTHLFKEEAMAYIDLHVKRDSISLEKHKELEKTYAPENRKVYPAIRDIKYFWNEMDDYNITENDFETAEITQYIGAITDEPKRKKEAAVIFSLKVKGHLINISVYGTYYEENKYNFDEFDIESVVVLVD